MDVASLRAVLAPAGSPVEELSDTRLAGRGVRLLVKRDDLVHPVLPGNKWRKLAGNLVAAAEQDRRRLVTFGGAYSNHIRATAIAGQLFGFETVGVIRGEEHVPLNPVLAEAVERGMHLTYLDRSTYRRKDSPDVVAGLRERWGEFYPIPEGGSNELAVRGCADLAAEIGSDVEVVCCPVGTGGTLAGIAAGLGSGQRAVGFSALKGAYSLVDEVAELQRRAYGRVFTNWRIDFDHHCGGYARRPPELESFITWFKLEHGLRLEWVYVAKMMLGAYAMIERGDVEPGSTVVCVITGAATP